MGAYCNKPELEQLVVVIHAPTTDDEFLIYLQPLGQGRV